MKRVLAGLAVGIAMPVAAAAHSVFPGTNGFEAGAYNLIGGPVDVLVWIALAGLAGLYAQRQAGWVAECFAAGVLAGLLGAHIAQAGLPFPLIELAPLLATGGLIVVAWRPPVAWLYSISIGNGLTRGWHYGAEVRDQAVLAAVAGGATLASYTLLACATAAILWFAEGRGGWRLISLRAMGSWICAIAIMLAGVALRHDLGPADYGRLRKPQVTAGISATSS